LGRVHIDCKADSKVLGDPPLPVEEETSVAVQWNKDDQEQSGDKLSISMPPEEQNASKMSGDLELTGLATLDAIAIADEWCELVV
jgi:hypothetical protein